MILRTAAPSRLHELGAPPADEPDEVAIVVEPPEYVLGLSFLTPSARTREGVDFTVYGLRDYCRMALSGDPTVLLPLFAPDELTSICTQVGAELRRDVGLIIACDLRSAVRRHVERARERVADVGGAEQAMNALRVAHQSLELLETERITLPFPEPERARLLAVGRGEVKIPDALAELDRLIERLEAAPMKAMLPPPELQLDQWLVQTYREHWERTWKPTYLE